MKRKHKLHLTAFLFLIFTTCVMTFILKDSNNYNYDFDKSLETSIQNISTNDEIKNINNKEEKAKEEINWQPIIEKYRGKEITKIETDKKIIALTFDAGANADGVEKTLEILEKENIKGTFFLTGKFIEKYPDKVQMIINSEGDIGNHSYSHPHFTQISDSEIVNELEKTEKAMEKFDLKLKPFFRFPYGDRNSESRKVINNKNYIDIRWTIDSLGWKGTSGGITKESIENRVISKTSSGAIIMMHLGSNPDDKSHLDSDALPEIIKKLKEQGYEFVTLMELFNLED